MEEQAPGQAPDTNQIIEERRAKLNALRARGTAYPNDFRRTHLAADIVKQHDATARETQEAARVSVTVAGRIMLKRVLG